jgi:exonuclease III
MKMKFTLGNKGLKIAHLNIQSLRNKTDHVNMLLHNSNIDCLCLSETWLSNDIDDYAIKIDGYNLCRIDRKYQSHGGIALLH